MLGFLKRARYSTFDVGKEFDRRVFLQNSKGENISFWNSLSLKNASDQSNKTIFNAIIEIPRYNIAKMELSKTEKYHPLMHDTKRDKKDPAKKILRYYAQFPLFNYGFFPQTWENCLIPNKEIENLLGDDDPLDLVEVSDQSFDIGSIVPVKALGTLCLIDQGEIDWKIICCNIDFANKNNINSIDDLDKAFPCRLEAIKRWFKTIKVYDGKKPNRFYYNENILDIDKTLEIIYENHAYWKELKNCKIEKLSGRSEDYIINIVKKHDEYHMN